jgi:hypothetical protein
MGSLLSYFLASSKYVKNRRAGSEVRDIYMDQPERIGAKNLAITAPKSQVSKTLALDNLSDSERVLLITDPCRGTLNATNLDLGDS